MLTFIIVLVVLHFTGLLPIALNIVMFLMELVFTFALFVVSFGVFLISCIPNPFKSK